MGATKQVFRKSATERQRREFLDLCARLEIEAEMLEPATVSNGGERVASTIYLEMDEHVELSDLVQHFGLTKSGLTRTCYRLGCALLTKQMEEATIDGEEV